MRLFIGIQPDDITRARIAHEASLLRPSVPGRYVSPENYHLTLAFLGQREPESIAMLQQTLASVAMDHSPFDLQFIGFGVFGQGGNTIVYTACAVSTPLLELTVRLRNQLTVAGESFDPKPLVPHVTLIRKATISPGTLPYWPEPVPLSVSRLTLFHSTRVEDRLTYLPIWETPLSIYSKEDKPS